MKEKRLKYRAVITTEMHKLRRALGPHRDSGLVQPMRGGSELVLPEHTAMLLGITPREVYRRVEDDTHFIEFEAGRLLICTRGSGTEISGNAL